MTKSLAVRLLNVAAEFPRWNRVTDKIRTFVDSGVLITAARGSGESAYNALAILDDPEREFVSSFFIRLEVIPKPSYFNRKSELSFYNNFFDAVAIWADPKGILDDALSTACKFGLSAVDSLHIAAALSAGATEFVTTELPTKPLHRVPDIRVTTI